MTIQELKDYFPEFDTYTDSQIQRAIDLANATTDQDVLGNNFELGLKYLTAHFIVISSNQFSGNVVSTKSISSKSVDGVSISYNDGLAGDSLNGMLNTTSYGQMYLRLTMGCGVGGFTC